jgi:Tol biopolymer transport system component
LFLGKTAQVTDLYLLNLETKELINISDNKNLEFDLQYLSYPKWGKDGKSIYFISKVTGIAKFYQLNIENGNLTNPIAGDDTNYYFDISSDGKMTYTKSSTSENPTVYIKNNAEEYPISKKGNNCMLPAFSPKGDFVAYKTMPLGEVHLYSVDNKKEIKTNLPKKNCTIKGWLNDSICVYTAATFSPEGSILKTLATYNIQLKSNEIIDKSAESMIDILVNSFTNSLMWFLNNTVTIYSIGSNEKHDIPLNGIPLYWSEKGDKLIFKSIKGDKLFLYNLKTNDIQELIK